jgi:hypothetical protein
VDLLQDPQRAQRDVLEVADRRGDQKELAYARYAFGAYAVRMSTR